MIKAFVLAVLCATVVYCGFKLWSLLSNKQSMGKETDMNKETKKTLWISGLLVVANALGVAYLLNPRKFEEKKNQVQDAVKSFFAGKK